MNKRTAENLDESNTNLTILINNKIKKQPSITEIIDTETTIYLFKFEEKMNVQLYKTSLKLEVRKNLVVELNNGNSSKFGAINGRNFEMKTHETSSDLIRTLKITLPLQYIDVVDTIHRLKKAATDPPPQPPPPPPPPDIDISDAENENNSQNTDTTPLRSILLKKSYLLTLDARDLQRIRTNDFANDNIIDYFLRDILREGELQATFTFSCKILNLLTNNNRNFDLRRIGLMFNRLIFSKDGYRNNLYHLIEQDFVFLPCNLNKNHWILFVIYAPAISDATTPMIYVVDSCHTPRGYDAIERLVPVLHLMFNIDADNKLSEREYAKNKRVRGKRGFYVMNIPQQQDSQSCGYFVLYYLKWFLTHAQNRHLFARRVNNIFGNPLTDIVLVKMFSEITQDVITTFVENTIKNVLYM